MQVSQGQAQNYAPQTASVDGLQSRLTSAVSRCHELYETLTKTRKALIGDLAPPQASANRPPISGCVSSLIDQLHTALGQCEDEIEAIGKAL